MRDKANQGQSRPYMSLGLRLRRLREKQQKSLDEVSGAVEINAAELQEIESGKERPSEDILMLLMNHFSLADNESVKLWELAGYDFYDHEDHFHDHDAPEVKQIMVLPMDARIVYTDMAHIIVNHSGVVMNFMQQSGLGGQPLAVARLGMSRDQAKRVMETLQKSLEQNALPERDSKGKGTGPNNSQKKTS